MKTLRSHIVQFLNSIFSILRNLPCAHELLNNRCTIAPLLWAHVKTNIVGGPSSFFPYARKFLKSKRENKSGCCLFFFLLPMGVVDVWLDIFLYGELSFGI